MSGPVTAAGKALVGLPGWRWTDMTIEDRQKTIAAIEAEARRPLLGHVIDLHYALGALTDGKGSNDCPICAAAITADAANGGGE